MNINTLRCFGIILTIINMCKGPQYPLKNMCYIVTWDTTERQKSFVTELQGKLHNECT